MAYKVGLKAPALDEFANLRTQVKWQNPDDEILKEASKTHYFGLPCTTLIS